MEQKKNPRPDIHKTNVMLSRKTVRNISRHMLGWEEQYEFPIDLKVSHCMNAALDMIAFADSPDEIRAEAKKEGKTDEEIEMLLMSYEWFVKKFLEKVEEVLDNRMAVDKRRIDGQ
ncbi:hypothetical protein ACFROC_36840 [Nocardia tengchongensis]|uniref:hypothetical protein n=1 Tax=Nocardia tengchongensis TaxID=2055889 RepID=UPI00369780FE